jgi:iron complex outermembrane recepter protein
VLQQDSLGRDVAAGFAQVNVPIFGQGFTLPLVQRLELEISDRYDSYSDFGGTNNPRYSADWGITDGLALRGSWGTNFVAPSFKSLSGVLGRVIQPRNVPGFANVAACATVGGTPTPGSAPAILNPTCSVANQFPIGIQIGSGGVGGLAGVLRPADYHLLPETSKDWSLGFDIAPTTGLAGFLRGLDINATWFNVQIHNAIQLMGTNIGLGLNDPATAFTYILRGDPRFNAALTYIYNSPLASNIQNINPNAVQFIEDGSFWNVGGRDVQGVDFNASYVLDLGDFGAWNTGATGTYYGHDYTTLVPGEAPSNAFNTGGQELEPRMRYRARLGLG